MKPAFSVIFFTVFSGAGYGLLALLSLGFLPVSDEGGFSLIHFLSWAVGFAFVGTGLLSSLFHLGHPERFLLALTQWKTSWLSREGVLSLFSFLPLGMVAIGQIWFALDNLFLGLFCLIVIIATVYSTSMIYGSLKTIRLWHQPLTAAVFLSFSLSTGWVLLLIPLASAGVLHHQYAAISALLMAISFMIKLLWQQSFDLKKPVSTPETATGLGDLGKVSLLDRPHMNENYLLQEMGFSVARKHAEKLHNIGSLLLVVAPVSLLFLAVFLMPNSVFSSIIFFCAAFLHLSGVFVFRWLFFAKARHTVMLYYGTREV